MTRIVESDVCIIGAGIAGAMVADRLADETNAHIAVVEAGNQIFNHEERWELWRRNQAYGENPWPGSFVEDQTVVGEEHSVCRIMAVGGAALAYGGASPRFTAEDFRLKSLYGVGHDWPLDYEQLEPYYQEAEERIGVAGEQGPPELDVRSKPYPMPPLPLSYTLKLLKEWGTSTGIPFWTNPQAKNTQPFKGRGVCCRLDSCNMCPIRARYSPDLTFYDLVQAGRIDLIPRTLVRKLIVEAGSERIERAVAIDRDNPEETVELRAKVFVLAGGFIWAPHLLLLSASSRYPDGLANSSGLVGKYMCGHRYVTAHVGLPIQLYPGINRRNSLLSKRFQRPGPLEKYVRHDLRIWESTVGDEPRFQDETGTVLLGDEVLSDWRERAKTGGARLRSYYDVIPHRESTLTLDGSATNRWGDPLPRLDFRDSAESAALRGHTEESIRGVFEELAKAGNGKFLSIRASDIQDHAGGGCRMGADPGTSAVDRYGRAHDHENLFVVGAPTKVSAGCCNGALTIQALSLLAASKIGEDFPAAT